MEPMEPSLLIPAHEEYVGGVFPDRSLSVLAVTAIMITLAAVFVLFRMASRVGIVKKLGWDDYFMILALVIAFGMSFSICYATRWGLGRHDINIPFEWFSLLKTLEYIFTVLYQPALMASKTSILIFYLHLSKGNSLIWWLTIVTMVVVNTVGFALTMLSVFQCRPLKSIFDPRITASTCIDILSLYLSSSPLNLITDLAMLFLPMPLLTGMRLPRKQKIILIITFGFGLFVTAIDVVRVAYLQQALETRLQEAHDHPEDQSPNNYLNFHWYAALSYMWSAVEVNVGIMCGCVPALKPLASRFLPRVLRDDRSPSTEVPGLTLQTARKASEQNDLQPMVSEPEQVLNAERAVDEPMGMMDFIDTPNLNQLPSGVRPSIASNAYHRPEAATPRASVADDTFYGFIDIQQRRKLVNLTARQSLFPITMVTILFFLWGFEYGLIDVLNRQFQQAVDMSDGQLVALHSAYFSGYFVAPLTFGRIILKRLGFKPCFLAGLFIYACGILVFWPSAVLTSFPALIISNIIVGMGLATLEVGANPFIALCGPSAYAEVRLSISQGIQAIGSLVSPLLAERALYKVVADKPSLIDAQWAYLGIALFTVLLAVVYYYLPLPDGTDEDFETAPPSRNAAFPDHTEVRIPFLDRWTCIGRIQIVTLTAILGVGSLFFYCGGQEAVSTSIVTYINLLHPFRTLTISGYQSICHGIFAFGRFLAAGLIYFIKPRRILLSCFLGALIFSICAMNFRDINDGVPSVTFIVLISFFEGPIFSIIYAMAIRGTGKHVKMTSTFLTAAISGGACLRPIMFVAFLRHDALYSYWVVVMAFACGTVFPLWLWLDPRPKKIVDPGQRLCDCSALRKPKGQDERKGKMREQCGSGNVNAARGPEPRGQEPSENIFEKDWALPFRQGQEDVEHSGGSSRSRDHGSHEPSE
ncbi:MFS general substrate transporter [Eremomyces bilateralis CBS 781.70]|uniref:MFS general substrate transporter n=1 Tax=Eremomyces bilateralis CBS 781.70 TaxID=1392243 RepID=A0A6G1FWZ4_9PEZI|nr:MFS general substrate transporter [Eremomyces bilateralis CBS 781.70]KAF1810294.1 MFS general substrate transporter [Eremomyces bilateralis CBS 781.70]